MLEQIARIVNPLKPLPTRKIPWLAFVLGFCFSRIALASTSVPGWSHHSYHRLGSRDRVGQCLPDHFG
jgi:hypothetical protein